MVQSKIGVVVPTLNSATTLEWALCSLRSQRGVSVEVVVVDSGSRDGTLAICKSWGVRTIYVPPGNLYRAINEGLRQMDTGWVACLPSDDMVYPDSYARLIAEGEQQQASLVYGDNDFIDLEGRFLFTLRRVQPDRIPGIQHWGNNIGFPPHTAVWRRTVFEELGGFNERYRLASDYDFFYRLVSSGYSLAKLNGPTVAAFRRHRGQLSVHDLPAVLEEKRAIRASMGSGRPIGGLLDVLAFHLQNSPTHLWRLRSKRTWHRRLRKLVGDWRPD